MHSLRFTILSLTFSFLAGCGLTLGEAPRVQNTCSGDDDCPGARCETATGMCITPELSEPFTVGLLVSPPMASTVATPSSVAFDAFAVRGPAEQDLAMPASIVAAGRVQWAATGERVAAQIRFVQTAALPGGQDVELSTSTTPDTTQLASGVMADYQQRVIAGETYDVVVEPSGDVARVLPPLYLTGVQAPTEGDIWNLNINYPAQMSEVTGGVLSVEGGTDIPENGLQVRAIDLDTGRVLSSTALTGSTATLPLAAGDPGSFLLRLSPGAGAFVLRVTAGDDRPLFPTLTIDPSLVFPGTVVVPSLDAVRYEGQVEAVTTSGRVQVPNAAVTLRSDDLLGDVTGVTGTFRTTVTTDAEGRFTAYLLPGNYDVVVVPPSSTAGGPQNLAVLVQQGVHIETGAVIRGQLFTVPSRARLAGEVSTVDGRSVPGADVLANTLGRMVAGGDPASPYNRSSSTVTDALGQFDLRVDAGAYDLFIKPPAGSGFPWIVVPEWNIPSVSDDVSDQWQMLPPIPVRGVLRGADGEPFAGAEIKAFVAVPDGAGATRSLAVARVVTEDDGSYELLLPPGI